MDEGREISRGGPAGFAKDRPRVGGRENRRSGARRGGGATVKTSSRLRGVGVLVTD